MIIELNMPHIMYPTWPIPCTDEASYLPVFCGLYPGASIGEVPTLAHWLACSVRRARKRVLWADDMVKISCYMTCFTRVGEHHVYVYI